MKSRPFFKIFKWNGKFFEHSQTVKYINLFAYFLTKMRDDEFCDFLPLFGRQKWAVRCIVYYLRYPQRLFTTILIPATPFDGENAKFLRDLNIIVIVKFYTESTEKHLESDFCSFWKYQKSPSQKALLHSTFYTPNSISFLLRLKWSRKYVWYVHPSCQLWKKYNVDSPPLHECSDVTSDGCHFKLSLRSTDSSEEYSRALTLIRP